MCYDVATLTKKKAVYSKKFEVALQSVQDVKEKVQPVFHTNGFTHPLIPVITNEQPDIMQAYEWGLIPFWAKDAMTATKISNQTLNARLETIDKKPSFRQSAGKKHCLVIVDGFYEYHHLQGKAYPFYIQRKDSAPFALAGLWETWIDNKVQISKSTFSIVTAPANEMMSKIHNNPKLSGPRMPLVLSPENEKLWLELSNLSQQEEVIDLIVGDLEKLPLKAHPVPKLRGKAYIGNRPEIQEAVNYTEVKELLSSL